MTPALELEGASVRRGPRRVLEAATLSALPGEVLGVIGANGAGKTTLLRAALGLAHLEAGSARLGGRDVHGMADTVRAALVAYLPQERRVGWNLPAWRVASLGAFHRPPAEAKSRAHAALTRVGLGDLADRGVLDMSGGERGRALLARLLAAAAPLLVADEPAAGLDPDAQLLALELFREEARRGAAVVLTLHDLSLAARTCDRLAVLHEGRIIADAPPREALTPTVLAQAFALDGRVEETANGPIVSARRRA
ncbi:ABC transporter ATP-binding protein [Phenylobacterium hankyongense]|uniref:ABC transporter ATP-binding protein n=1 Tax=Phenylobacterium hankyongense TaxID=1813876 RepID=A0A328B2S2_9CAUL|nr:ABC transporter ATP-binding protein [Phenylobacterium hankyongense]RAK61503.1 ABC transporter ATP-binding protein [Phenylobacterium hankyongense]